MTPTTGIPPCATPIEQATKGLAVIHLILAPPRHLLEVHKASLDSARIRVIVSGEPTSWSPTALAQRDRECSAETDIYRIDHPRQLIGQLHPISCSIGFFAEAIR